MQPPGTDLVPEVPYPPHPGPCTIDALLPRGQTDACENITFPLRSAIRNQFRYTHISAHS